MTFRQLIVISLLLLSNVPGQAIEVAITTPTEGQEVWGVVDIQGTSADLVEGRVAIAIDDGPFEFATGTDTWSFQWSTQDLAGPHTITARARECASCPAAVAIVEVTVVGPDGLSVGFTSPEAGTVVTDTLTVVGTSVGADLVELAVDGGLFQQANGLDPWTVVFEPGALEPGEHLLTARATDGEGAEAFAELAITVGDPPAGVHDFTYTSSVDGVPMNGIYYLPQGHDPDAGPVGLVMHLHGGGGVGSISDTMQEALDTKGWIGISPDGREWGLHDPDDPDSCPWRTSAAYVDHPDPDVGPGERDMLDAIAWAQQTFDIDPDRIYLQGFSMGGRGTYIIGLKNPDLFAAIAPLGPAIDMYEVFVRRPNPTACKEGMVGGKPGDSPMVDTFYSITSGRFLIENAYNLPVFHGHGTQDTVANNTPTGAPFLHGWHITTDTGWDECHDILCFGHTPTLAELAERHGDDPEAHDWAYFFSPVGHQTDPRWLLGGTAEDGDFGVDNPSTPGDLLGVYDFFAARTRRTSPETVVYKSYTDQHRRAYWTQISITDPWQDLPGAIRARRDSESNQLELELVRVAEAVIELAAAQLELSPKQALTVEIQPLNEPVYDPALIADGETTPILSLEGFSPVNAVEVLRDGMPVPQELVVLEPGTLSIGPLTLSEPTVLEITVLDQGSIFQDGFESGDVSAWSLEEGR